MFVYDPFPMCVSCTHLIQIITTILKQMIIFSTGLYIFNEYLLSMSVYNDIIRASGFRVDDSRLLCLYLSTVHLAIKKLVQKYIKLLKYNFKIQIKILIVEIFFLNLIFFLPPPPQSPQCNKSRKSKLLMGVNYRVDLYPYTRTLYITGSQDTGSQGTGSQDTGSQDTGSQVACKGNPNL